MALYQKAYQKGYTRAEKDGLGALLTPEKADVYSAVWHIPGLDNATIYFKDLAGVAKEKGIGAALAYDLSAFSSRICYAAGVVTQRAEHAADLSTQVVAAAPAKTLDALIWMFEGASVHPKYVHAQEKVKEAVDDFTHTDELGEMAYHFLQGIYFQAVSNLYTPTNVHLKNVKEAYLHEGIGAAIKIDCWFAYLRLISPVAMLLTGPVLHFIDSGSREMMPSSHLYKSWRETEGDVRKRLEQAMQK